ncbi:hypothetical protein SOHN41_00813 [Shewanella sp. HN-41]|nr:hypothetical protein SOHN41_00813 [Shewanella sp. HN-41]
MALLSLDEILFEFYSVEGKNNTIGEFYGHPLLFAKLNL